GADIDHTEAHSLRLDPHGSWTIRRRAGTGGTAPGVCGMRSQPSAHQGETPLDVSRVWVEFTDPAEPAPRARADLAWHTSEWRCLFGTGGCPGIYADRPADGCCTLGAHFTDEDDVSRVAAVAARLSPADWQFHAEGTRPVDGRPGWQDVEDGGASVTTRQVAG